MIYETSVNHPGWIYDNLWRNWISPSGRLAEYPGAPFKGTLSKRDFDRIKEDLAASIAEEDTGKDMAKDTRLSLELTKSVKVGDITINWYTIS